MSASPDREQLKRDCADALETHLRDQRVDRLSELAETLRVLGPPYRFHGEVMHGARRDGQENAITWHLQVLAKLEEQTRPSAGREGAAGVGDDEQADPVPAQSG